MRHCRDHHCLARSHRRLAARLVEWRERLLVQVPQRLLVKRLAERLRAMARAETRGEVPERRLVVQSEPVGLLAAESGPVLGVLRVPVRQWAGC